MEDQEQVSSAPNRTEDCGIEVSTVVGRSARISVPNLCTDFSSGAGPSIAALSGPYGPRERPRVTHVTHSFLGASVWSLRDRAPIVEGGLFEALGTLTEGPIFVVRFNRNVARLAHGFYLSPQSRRGGEPRNCTLRHNGRCVRSAGILSLWKGDGEYLVAYTNGGDVLSFFECLWAMSAVERNRLMHALNGNTAASPSDLHRAEASLDVDEDAAADVVRARARAGTLLSMAEEMGFEVSSGSRRGKGRDRSMDNPAHDGGTADFVDPGLMAEFLAAGGVVAEAEVPPREAARRVRFEKKASERKALCIECGCEFPRTNRQIRDGLRTCAECRAVLSGSSSPQSEEHTEPTPPAASPKLCGDPHITAIQVIVADHGAYRLDGPFAPGKCPPDDRKTLYLGSVLDWEAVRPGDRLACVEFNEPAWHGSFPYVRGGDRLRDVYIRGERYDAADWLFDVVPIHSGLLAEKVTEFAMDPPVHLFEFVSTQAEYRPVRHRYSSIEYKDVIYERFAGRKTTELVLGGERVYVPSADINTVLRYFSNDLAPRVCASHIMGQLKNNENLDAQQIDAIIRYACAYQDSKVVEYARNVAGDIKTRRRVDNALAHRDDRWWYPTHWVVVDLFAGFDTIKTPLWLKRLLLFTWFLLAVVLSLDFYVQLGVMGIIRPTFAVRWADTTISNMGYNFVPGNRTLVAGRRLHMHIRPGEAVPFFERASCVGTIFGVPVDFWHPCGRHVRHLTIASVGETVTTARRYFQELEVGYRVGILRRVMELVSAPNDYNDATAYYFLVHCVLSPLLEEFAKAFLGYKGALAHTACIIVYEFVSGGMNHRYWATALMHLFAFFVARQSYVCAFGVHSVYNMLVSGLLVSYAANRAFVEVASQGFPVGSTAALVGVAGFFAAAVRLYNRGSASWFRKIPAAGQDSQFVEAYQDPGSTMATKEGEIRVKPGRRVRGRNVLTGLMTEFVPVTSFEGNQANALHSLVGRVMKETPPQTRNTAGLVRLLDEVSGKMGHCEPEEVEHWAAKFPPGKRTRYLHAAEKLCVFGISWFARKVCGAPNPWAKRSCFIKHEINLAQEDKVLSFTRKYRVASSDPRTIQASTDEVQVLLGPYITAFGNRASAVFDGGTESRIGGVRVLMAFGRTKSEVATIIQDCVSSGENAVIDCGDDGFIVWNRRVYAIDATRWDAHVGPGLLRLKYRHMVRLGMPRRVARVMDDMIKRTGSYKGLGVGFTVEGDVASGDPDTLYWNTVLGVVLIVDCMLRSTTFAEFCERSKEYGIEYELAGDASRSHAGPTLDFCSCVMAPSGESWSFAPKLGRAIMKCTAVASNGNPAKLLASKIQGLTYDLGLYPEVVKCLRRLLVHLPSGCGPVSESYFPVGKAEPGSLDARREFIAARYGVCYDEVVDEVGELVERTKRGESRGGDLLNLRRLVAVDYGKEPLSCEHPPEPFRPGRRVGWNWFSRPAVLFAIFLLGCVCSWGVGGTEIRLRQSSTSAGVYNTNFENLDFISMAGKNKGKKGGKAGRTQPRKNKGPAQPKKIKGAGDYTLAAKVLAGAVASRLGQMVPKGTFERTGARMGRGLANIVGFGDYVMNDIVSVGGAPKRQGGQPQIVSNCEYVTDVKYLGTTNFSLVELEVNAYAPGTFPWLAAVAKQYTKYRFKQLVFEYRSMSSDYSNATGLGTVVMAPMYNVLGENFKTKQQMEAATHAVSFKPSNSSMCGIECYAEDNMVKWFNVRNRLSMERTPFTDPLKFFYALSGVPTTVPTNTTLGELWVHYTIELIEPLLASPVIASAAWAGCNVRNTAVNAMAGGGFGLAASYANNTLGVNADGTSPNTLFLAATAGRPPGGDGYFVAFDTTVPTRLWFNSPGTYTIVWTANYTTAPSFNSQASNGFWSVAPFQSTITNYSNPFIWPFIRSWTKDLKGWTQTFIITTYSPDTALDFTQQSGVNATNAVLEAADGAGLCVVYTP